MSEYRTGQGWDVHRLAAGRPLILGGVSIPSQFGLEGHSDADVLAHAITDAILGAAAIGDIGMHFPDTDPRWKDCDSLVFLRQAQTLARGCQPDRLPEVTLKEITYVRRKTKENRQVRNTTGLPARVGS